MEIKASIHNLRISPQKVRLAIDLIRGMDVKEATRTLAFLNRGVTPHLQKLLKSAVANAKNNFELKTDDLYIKSIFANDGTTLKRYMPRAHGRADVIRKRASHIHLILEEKNPTKTAKKEKKEVKKTVAKKVEKKSAKKDTQKKTTAKPVKKKTTSKSAKK